MTEITKYTLEQYTKSMELKNKGYGSQRISKLLNLPNRSTVEGWINRGMKPYYFSEKRIRASNSIENVERMRAMNKLTQHKAVQISAELRTKRLPERAKTMSEELAYILGVVYGDGHISTKQRRVMLSATDEDFVLEFKANLEKWSKFEARYTTRKLKLSEGIKSRKLQYLTYIDSKEASSFLKKVDINKLIDFSQNIKCSFLRGLFDSEAHVLDRGIRFFNTKKELVLLVKKLLESLSVLSTITQSKTPAGKPYYYLNIYRKDSVLNYNALIGFTIKRKQRRITEQVTSIKAKTEDNKMTEKPTRVSEEHTVFVGSKPFKRA
ncbi:MAG: LAGLIDADG family homing endonuclease [Candidatus Nanoarchaeia archaeon]|nr:LAGLIDADG family homing endonuclease [Candidatus Nanoarchaeia archaeon]